jgi:hypothetical protein
MEKKPGITTHRRERNGYSNNQNTISKDNWKNDQSSIHAQISVGRNLAPEPTINDVDFFRPRTTNSEIRYGYGYEHFHT